MSRWDKLSMGDRAALVSLFVNNGVVDPKEMRRIYDDGGDVEDIKPAVVEASYPREAEVLDLVNKSGADFVSRLKDENRVTIPDWDGKDDVATHKLGYAEVDGKYVVYPLVQNIDGKLYDFSDPQYGLDKGWQALDSALYAGDYVELPSKADAKWFTESYKNHYPGFNKYDGKTERSQQMVKLGKDDYLVPKEFDAAVITADRKPMSNKQIRKNSRIVRSVLNNLTEDGNYTPLQKKRMAEYIIRAQGGQPNPSLPRIIEMRKGLKHKNKNGVSGLERVLYGDESIKDLIDDINSDNITYDDYGNKIIDGFILRNYNGTLVSPGERYKNDIVDAYINNSVPYGGKEYSGIHNFGPYKNYINKHYKDRNIKSYIYGEQTLPKDITDRLDKYSYERGDNSFVVSANTNDGVPFRIAGDNGYVDLDAGGHLWQFIKDDDGEFYVRQSDSYDFEPDQYKESYGNLPHVNEAISALDSAGNPTLVFNQWRVATPEDLYSITNGGVNVDYIDENSINKAIGYNRKKRNSKFFNAVDNILTLAYGAIK